MHRDASPFASITPHEREETSGTPGMVSRNEFKTPLQHLSSSL